MHRVQPFLSLAAITKASMSDPAIPYEIGLIEDLADPEEAMAYLTAALEDGDQASIRLALTHAIEAQEIGQDDDDWRFSPEGWTRFRALMAQAKESIKAGRTLSSDEFWMQARTRYKDMILTP